MILSVDAPNKQQGQRPSLSQRLGKLGKWYLCGSSPGDNIKNWMIEGGIKGVVVGGIAGGVTGTVLGTPVGGAAGAFTGAVVDGVIGAETGIVLGSEASLVCYAFGVYK